MSEMVERVARALQDMLVDTKGEPLQPLSKVMAAIAIAAMRSPTEAMCDAALDAELDIYWSYCGDGRPGSAEDVWRAMADAALK